MAWPLLPKKTSGRYFLQTLWSCHSRSVFMVLLGVIDGVVEGFGPVQVAPLAVVEGIGAPRFADSLADEAVERADGVGAPGVVRGRQDLLAQLGDHEAVVDESDLLAFVPEV